MKPVVAVIAPGAMGAAVARRLTENGVDVRTLLAGRSAASERRASEAGMRPAAEADLAEVDILLSIVPPGEALALAERLAPVLARTGRALYADCNAVSPQTAERIGGVISAAGLRFADAGIIGARRSPAHAGHCSTLRASTPPPCPCWRTTGWPCACSRAPWVPRPG